MVCNPCCCFSLKDSAVMIGIWTLVFSIAQLGIMGWQMAAIKYEKDRAANTLLPNYNTYGKYDIPSYYESYWQSPEERYYTGLFVIQILCLIAAFFLLFASVALIYGVHTWSRHLIWPWFICIVSSILTSLAYCIMWWAGDVRDYWMALTILEIIGVFINVYCVVVVYMFMQRLAATTDEYEGKKPQVRYKVNRNGYTRKPLDDYRTMYQNYPPYSPSGMPQTPLPMPSSPYPPVPPYPVDEHERVRYDREPKARFIEKEEDPVAHWVKDQQKIGAHLNVDREAVMPTTLLNPSLQNQLMIVKDDDGAEHDAPSPSSQRPPIDGKEPTKAEEARGLTATTTTVTETVVGGGKNETETITVSVGMNATTTIRTEETRSSKGPVREDLESDDMNTEMAKPREWRDLRRSKFFNLTLEASFKMILSRTSFDTVPTEATFPLSGGISIPQHIVIPPSMGERGPDGNPLPQKFQINSEITINYDGLNPTPQSDPNEPYRRRYPWQQFIRFKRLGCRVFLNRTKQLHMSRRSSVDSQRRSRPVPRPVAQLARNRCSSDEALATTTVVLQTTSAILS
ncbi:hypothetical protein TELCIR_07571 [Teladorsagia circumcincta]|uniref:Uncharacterized protein n=2 Tax=Teladorsagia circumcincta TaxID=45464 RepID=A0A2G9UM50_TELCI|nr:hypothetical protein TELCIR_07571 [Teladorsagia circumcincta]